MKTTLRRTLVLTLVLLSTASLCDAQARKKNKNKKNRTSAKLPGEVIKPTASLTGGKVQNDFPSMCISPDGKVTVAYVEYTRDADQVKLAELIDDKLISRGAVSDSGDVYQPTVACDGAGTVWCIWSQMEAPGKWNVLARAIIDGKPAGETVAISKAPGANIFPNAKTDRNGRVWAAWQKFQGGDNDIYAAYLDPKKKAWSDPIRVTKHPAGDWEPRLAFGKNDEALIVFDSYRGGNYDVYLAKVTPEGKTTISPIVATKRYEARAHGAVSPDGKTLWVAYEDGPVRWGKDLGSEWRKTGGGLNYGRHLYLIAVDLATGKVTPAGDIAPLIPGLAPARGSNSSAINQPEVVVDAAGAPWVFYRYYRLRGDKHWKAAVTRYDADKKTWIKPLILANSSYCQDRRVSAGVDNKGQIIAVWPSDGRKGKQQGVSAVHLATIGKAQAAAFPGAKQVASKPVWKAPAPVNSTPERKHGDRHTWTFDETKYELYWGDFHRHTDFSNCRTPDDGCIVEHYRYALDAAGLDYLATTDHTDAGKTYHEYEWFQSQKYTDMFHNPAEFLSFYAYEREQTWPYGHRNVIFIKRGGPIVYISRKNYLNSRWAKALPPPPIGKDNAKPGQLPPWDVWDILRRSDMRCITIEHTSAGGMGTDWGVYKEIDYKIETLVEIYQGSRNSYEGNDLPQPKVATPKPMNFGKHSAGTYQNALKLGHKLGVFASSDHRSTGVTFGGVYVKKFDRSGVFDAADARRTIAATDKIFMEFSCNARMLGEIFETSDKPAMKIAVNGTAPIEAVTVVRNEKNYKTFTPAGGKDFQATFTDDKPVSGENRYYIRVIQKDGNMGWTSPVWVKFKP
ncbi:MAG: hypothetical protein QGH60_10295 [Phycisphaerae bacterium]|jgi:hypothetical protein|nr:hypothetical protein [Phycisphaerae bacterium]